MISGRRRCTYLLTVEYDTRASCSSTSRSKIRLAVCRCLTGAARSSRSISSIHPVTASRTGAARTGTLRSGGSGEAIACRTVRRCTSYLRASDRIDIRLRCQSKRIAANSSTLCDPIPAHPRDEPSPTPSTIRLARAVVPHQPGVSSPPAIRWGQIKVLRRHRGSSWVGPNQRRTVGPFQSATAKEFCLILRAEAQLRRDTAAASGEDTSDYDQLIDELD